MFMRRVGEELMKGDDVPRDLIVTIQMHNYSFYTMEMNASMLVSVILTLIAQMSEVSGSPETWGR